MPGIAQSTPPLQTMFPTDRPCAECHGVLLLVSVSPAKAGALARLYQCQQCSSVEKVITNAKWMNWLTSDVTRPA